MTYRDRDRVIRWLEAGNGEKLTLLDRVILRDIAEAANSETGHAWLGQDTLSARWGRDKRSVQRSIARLHEFGLLTTAEPGRWHRRARYALSGELDRATPVSPYEPATGRHPGRNRVTEVSQQGDRGVADRVTEVSPVYRSHHGIKGSDDDSDDDAPRRASRALASDDLDLPAGVDNDLIDQVAETLKIPTSEAKRWIADTLNGRQIRTSIPAYIRACMKNYRPAKPPASSRNGPPETTPTHDEQWNICGHCGGRLVLGLDVYPVGSPEYQEMVREAKTMIEAEGRRTWGRYYHPDCWPACPKCGAPWQRGRPQPKDGICSRCRDSNEPASQQMNLPRAAVEKMAAIFGDDTQRLEEDGELEITIERAGIYLSAWTSLQTPDLVTVVSEFDDDSPWPEGKPLPDEPFRDRAKARGAGCRDYRPYDAVAIAEAWHEATREETA